MSVPECPLLYSCVLSDFKLLKIGEYSVSSLVTLLVQESCSFFVNTNLASCNEFIHSTVNEPGVSGIVTQYYYIKLPPRVHWGRTRHLAGPG